jgi:hypothetical protein
MDEILAFIPSLICICGVAHYSPHSRVTAKFKVILFPHKYYQICWQEGCCCPSSVSRDVRNERE